jgi:hypothetical protein
MGATSVILRTNNFVTSTLIPVMRPCHSLVAAYFNPGTITFRRTTVIALHVWKRVDTSYTNTHFYSPSSYHVILTTKDAYLHFRSYLWAIWFRSTGSSDPHVLFVKLSERNVHHSLKAVKGNYLCFMNINYSLKMAGRFIRDYTAQQTRRQPSLYSQQWEPEISLNYSLINSMEQSSFEKLVVDQLTKTFLVFQSLS